MQIKNDQNIKRYYTMMTKHQKVCKHAKKIWHKKGNFKIEMSPIKQKAQPFMTKMQTYSLVHLFLCKGELFHVKVSFSSKMQISRDDINVSIKETSFI